MIARECLWEGGGVLLAVGEVDFDLRLGDFGVGSEAPTADGVFGCVDEEGVAGLDLGAGDGTVGLDGDEQDDFACDVHAVGELGIGGRDTADYGSMDVDGKRSAGTERQASQKQKREGRTKFNCQRNLQG